MNEPSIIIFIELVILFWLIFDDKGSTKVVNLTWFWIHVLFGLIIFYTLGRSTCITMSNRKGEILKQIYIGKDYFS